MPINLPQNVQNAFDGNMQANSKVELPFYAPAFWVLNGKPSMRQLGGVQYFGGFACEQKKVEDVKDHLQVPVPPPGLNSIEYIPDDGANTLNVYAARSLYTAIIGVRQFSIAKVNGEDRRVAPFTPGARPGIQVLAVLGYRDETEQIVPWSPVLLTAKGYQVNNLGKAVNNWTKAVKPVLKKMGLDGAHPGLFWSAIGTFGSERKQELVGSVANKRAITPVSVFIPNEITEDTLTKLYVGEEVAAWMIELSGQAKDWLHAFDNLAPASQAQTAAVAEPEMPEVPPVDEENIPFNIPF